jgi:hypothetical protein
MNVAAVVAPQFHHLPHKQDDGHTNAPSTAEHSRHRRNVGDPGRYWPQNTTLKIALYEFDVNDPYVLAVKKAACQWLPHINLKFEFVSGEEGDVRIAANNQRPQSAVGTGALSMPESTPTMSLPLDHTDPRFEYIVLHEFGHMLGALHAHQHPDADIPWNVPKVHAVYRRNGVSQAQANADLLPLPRNTAYDYQPYDADSVMHYEIDPRLTRGNWAQSESWAISEGDIAWAKNAYPRPAS